LTAAESTVVFRDRVVRMTAVRTTAQDEWRAAIELAGHLDAGRRVIRVDASRVEFMDSTAAGALAAATARCREHHGTLILTGVRRPVQRLLELAGLDRVLLVDTADRE
jgi:anti-anti-sigma factor